MGLLRIRGELQLRVCNRGEPCSSSHMAKGGEHFYKEEEEIETAVANRVHGFSLTESLQREESLFFLLGSAVISRHECSLLQSSNSK